MPATATNVVDTTHTITALVRDSINDSVPDVVVNFTIISAPNACVVGVATTDTNGEAAFSWSSSAEGTNTVQAAINGAAGVITATATKDWYIVPNNVIPEVPLGTIAIAITMMFGFIVYYEKGRMHKSKKL